jgi:hypothetical protein
MIFVIAGNEAAINGMAVDTRHRVLLCLPVMKPD